MSRLAQRSEDDTSVLDKHGLAAVTLTMSWSDDRAVHEEQMHVEKFSVWREADILPRDIGVKIPGMRAGDWTEAMLQDGELTGTWEPARVISTHPARFDRHHHPGLVVEPHVGRFYPQGFFQGVHGIFNGSVEPARITALSQDRLDIDTNQPLSRYPLQVRFHLDRVLPAYDRRGGRCTSPLDDLVKYPGLAAPLADGQTVDYGDAGRSMARLAPPRR